MNRQGVLLVVAIVAVALLGALLLGRPAEDTPLDPRSTGPSGTKALVTLLRELGAQVDLDVGRPGPTVDVALVMRDRLDGDQHADLEEWVRDGGTLVVSDPASPLTPPVVGLPLVTTDTVDVGPGLCDFGPLDDLGDIDVFGGPVGYVVDESDESCYGDGATAYVVATPVGEGTLVALGGSGILVNRSLDERDNAPVAAAILAPLEGTHVAMVDPVAPAAEGDSLYDLIPAGVKRGLVQLALAFLVYVAWRARRLGRPVSEPQPVKVAGSELVSAVGGLLERTGSPQHAADVLRGDLRRDLIAQLGLPADIPDPAFVEIVSGHSSLDDARIRAALGPGAVSNDKELLNVAQLIDIVRQEVLVHVGA